MYLLLAGKTEIGGELSCVRFCAGILVVINKQSADRLQTPPPPMSELGLTIAIFTCYIICVSIILEYTMTRQLGSSVLSIYKWSGEGYRKWTEITANCSNVNNMTHSVCWWWLCGRRVCVILGTGVHRRRRLPPLVTVIWCLYIPHCLVTAQRPQITCVYAGITWNDLYND